MSLPTGEVFVSPEWVDAYRERVAIVDVRDPTSYATLGHIPGAVNIPIDRLRDPTSVKAGMLPDAEMFSELLGEAGLRSEDRIVAYDDTRGVDAARFLVTAGVFGHEGDLHLLDGDITAWQQSYPTDSDGVETEASSYTIGTPAHAPTVQRDHVEDAIDSDVLLVDTRTPTEFDQAHIPGAVHLGWEELVDGGTRRLHAASALEEILESRGITDDREIILYCNTARRLCHTYAVLQHLGYPRVSFYEGSLTDWIRAHAPEWSPVELEREVRRLGAQGIRAFEREHSADVLNRLKLVGLYHQKQEGYFMLRTKIPGGILSAEQARVIGSVADRFARAPTQHGGSSQNLIFGDAYLDITTRQDIQMHWIRLEDVPTIWDRYAEAGLTTLQACGNSVRNVVSCPAAGITSDETLDPQPIAAEITERFLGDTTYANLPRKLKVSITGCHENCARAQINDLAFLPAVKGGRQGFEAMIGGGLSDGPRMATDLDVFLEPDQVCDLVAATADLFIEYGSYLDTAVNRLRFLVEELGIDAVRENLDARLSFDLESAGASLTTTYRGDHVGIHEQRDGERYIGVNVPAGRMRGAEFRELAQVAKRYGDGEVRLTLNQNVLVPHLSPADIPAVLETAVLQRYSPSPGPFSRGLVACTGSEFCNFGIIETKSRGIGWARALDQWAAETGVDEELDVVRMHMSGCSASCAQPQIADIGLRGETYRDADGAGEAADVGIGGDLAAGEFTDWVTGKVPIEDVPPATRRLIQTFIEQSGDDQSFSEWSRAQPQADLAAVIQPPELVEGSS